MWIIYHLEKAIQKSFIIFGCLKPKSVNVKNVIKNKMMDRKVKQVIVWRNDLKVPLGKFGAQISHASKAPIVNAMRTMDPLKFTLHCKKEGAWDTWLNGVFTTIVVGCKDLDELMVLTEKAKDANIPHALIKDAGLTVFDGPTVTCLGIGPFWADEIDKITGHLRTDNVKIG